MKRLQDEKEAELKKLKEEKEKREKEGKEPTAEDEEKMKEYIASFIKEKDLSENSQTAYSYDLDQFVYTVHNHVSDTNLRIYQASIKDFKPAVQKRKLPAVNQFLFYLYQHQVH